MKYLLSVMLLALVSCAHHHEGSGHHHHQGKANYTKSPKDAKVKYDNHCASSVMEGDKHTVGKEEFQLEHGGQFYYFSTEEKMNEFKKNLTENAHKADKNWAKKP